MRDGSEHVAFAVGHLRMSAIAGREFGAIVCGSPCHHLSHELSWGRGSRGPVLSKRNMGCCTGYRSAVLAEIVEPNGDMQLRVHGVQLLKLESHEDFDRRWHL